MPPIAGLQEATQNTATPLYFAAATMLCVLPLYVLFRTMVIRRSRTV